jgi:hypothetical protein
MLTDFRLIFFRLYLIKVRGGFALWIWCDFGRLDRIEDKSQLHSWSQKKKRRRKIMWFFTLCCLGAEAIECGKG